jgi:hypothetical protein
MPQWLRDAHRHLDVAVAAAYTAMQAEPHSTSDLDSDGIIEMLLNVGFYAHPRRPMI